MPKLTHTQSTILSTAARRDTGAILPLPKTLKITQGAVPSVLKRLVKRGLATKRPAGPTDQTWHKAKDGQPMTLAITTAGLMAIGVDPDEAANSLTSGSGQRTQRSDEKMLSKTGVPPRRPGKAERHVTKKALVINMLERKGSATVTEIVEATGWQAHSVRAALTGVRKQGIQLDRDKSADGDTIYRVYKD